MELKVGDKIEDEYGSIRIMAIVEGYVIVRRPRCYPFLRELKEFTEPKYRHLSNSMHSDRVIPHFCEHCGRIEGVQAHFDDCPNKPPGR